jgi:DNA-binding beta-propeller fold protein YncE
MMRASLRGRRRDVLAGLACAIGVGAPTCAQATIEPALFDIRRYVYVPSTTVPDVAVIDTEDDRIAARLHTGIVARQAVVSRDTATLIATDGQSASVSLLDVVSGKTRTVALSAAVDRLTVGTTGQLVAASDLAGGTIALIDLGEERQDRVTMITGLPPLREVMFGDLDTALYIAAEGLSGVGVVDVAKAKLLHEIATFQPTPDGVAALARTPDGRQVLARPRGGGPISVLDPEQGRAVAQVAGGPGTMGIFPSGTGNYLLIPDDIEATLAVFRSNRLDDPVALPGAAGVIGVYTAWLDSIAFVPSAVRRSVLVYDLDKMHLVDEITLPGAPAAGAVTADSRTLYLPILDPPIVVAVDGNTRRIVATYDLPSPPLAALVAGGWGICH